MSLKNCLVQLNAINPLNVLERGYSITKKMPSMEIVKDAAKLKQDDIVNVKFSRGAADCKVEKTFI